MDVISAYARKKKPGEHFCPPGLLSDITKGDVQPENSNLASGDKGSIKILWPPGVPGIIIK
jgi:hypothetical protein